MKRGLPKDLIRCNDTDQTITVIPVGAIISFKSGEKPSRGAVRRASANQIVSRERAMSELSSSLADRYDGLMLGFFIAAAAEPSTTDRFSYLRGRINDYLADIPVPLELPTDRSWLLEKQDQVFKIVWHEISQRSAELGDFFFLEAGACVTITYASYTPEEVAGLKKDMLQKLETVGLEADVAHAFWARAPRPTADIGFDDMVSAALWLARACIEPLPEEPSSAFVSMPFAEPFATRYRQFYVPLLRAQGFRALRAWGGVAFEDYWDLLVALIKKASGFLADITGNNLNVLHEVWDWPRGWGKLRC
jgi:hypothetical protein